MRAAGDELRAAFNSNKGLYSQDLHVTRMDQKLALPYALRFADDLEEQDELRPRLRLRLLLSAWRPAPPGPAAGRGAPAGYAGGR